MKKTFRKIVQVLDGKPGAMKGQSLVEMAFTMPILIFMILGLAEIGWLANNYLILMDVVRSAGRAAVGASPGATEWNDSWTRNYNHMDCDDSSMTTTQGDPTILYHRLGNTTVSGSGELVDDARSNTVDTNDPHTGTGPRGTNLAGLPDLHTAPHDFGIRAYSASANVAANPEGALGFFDGIACQITNSFSPLIFNDVSYPQSKDDIVVSAISYQLMQYANGANNVGSPTANTINPVYVHGPDNKGGPGDGKHSDDWVTVTGRWPKSNRYCNPNATGTGNYDYRDPFDYKRYEFSTLFHDGSPAIGPGGALVAAGQTNQLDNFEGYGLPDDTVDGSKEPLGSIAGQTDVINDAPNHSVLNPSSSQNIRGYVFTGNSYDSASGCYGSKFTVQDIEDRLNLTDFNQYVPNGGLILIEVFWQHHPLVFGPLFEGFTGNPQNDPVLWVWGMFPLPSVEPTATACASGSTLC